MPRLAAFLFASALAASPALADELWRQNPINAVGGYSSQDARNPGGLGWFSEVADNFQAQIGWTVTSIEFWGGYVTELPGHTHGFTIRFYTDNNGLPGTRFSEQDVTFFTEEVYFTNTAQNWNGFHSVIELPQPVPIPTAGQYWVSIVAILDRGGTSPEPQWGWVQALDVDNHAPFARQRFFSPTFNPINIDMAFVLRGTVAISTFGACCRGGTCSFGHVGSCIGPNTRFAGSATTCNAPGNTQSPCCLADFNQTHGLTEPTVQDVFDFLTAFFAADPAADINGSGSAPTVQDVFDYLTAFFGGC